MKRLLLALVLASASDAFSADCRSAIRPMVCRVSGRATVKTRPCLGGEEEFATALEKAHDNLPPRLREMFCNITSIRIEEDYFASGYSAVLPGGNLLGLSRSKVFSGYSYQEWIARKEQTAFGIAFDEKPEWFSKPKPNDPDLLVYVLVHEFAHMLEETNGLVDAWARLHALNKPQYRPCFYFYDCKASDIWPAKDGISRLTKFYDEGNYISLYAAADAHEDFAETFTHNLLGLDRSRHSPLLNRKFVFVRRFMNSPWTFKKE